jgi:hypothetical protein
VNARFLGNFDLKQEQAWQGRTSSFFLLEKQIMKRIHILIYLKLFKQFIVTKGKGIPGQQVILG